MRAGELDEIREKISDIVLEEKSRNAGTKFIIGGDMNRRDLSPAVADFIDIREPVSYTHLTLPTIYSV